MRNYKDLNYKEKIKRNIFFAILCLACALIAYIFKKISVTNIILAIGVSMLNFGVAIFNFKKSKEE